MSTAGFQIAGAYSTGIFFLHDAVIEKEPVFQNLQLLPEPLWKQNMYLPECSMKATKSRDKKVGESKGQVRELMARRDGFTGLNLLLDTSLEKRHLKVSRSSVN